jgi:hypothetical protein
MTNADPNSVTADDRSALPQPQKPENRGSDELAVAELEQVAGGVFFTGRNHNQNLAQ